MKFLRIILGIAILLLLSWLGYALLSDSIAHLDSIDPNVAAALIAALVAVFGYFYTQRQAKSRDIAEAHRPQKIKVYENLLDVIQFLQESSSRGELDKISEDNVPKELQELFIKLTRGLIAWGSPSVIREWLRFREIAQERSPTILLDMDDVLRAVRADLGHKDSGLQRGDLVKLFLKDPKEVDLIMKAKH